MHLHPKVFQRIFFLLYFGLHFAAVVILKDVRAFAPDELSYIECFQSLYNADFNLQPFGGWWNANIFFLRVLYLPIKIFTFLPFSDLVLLRVYSIVLTFIALYLLMQFTKLTHSLLGKIALFVFTFTPSIFLWTTLAIKESFIILSFVIFFIGLYKIPNKSIGYTLCFLSGYSLLNLKGYLFVVLTLSILLCLTLQLAKNRKFHRSSFLLMLTLSAPYILSPATSSLILDSSLLFSKKLSEFRIVTDDFMADSPMTDSPMTDSPQTNGKLGMTADLLSNHINQNNNLKAFLSILHINEYLAKKESSYKELSSSELNQLRSLTPANPTNLGEFANGLSAFLLFPNVFRSNGSPILDLLGIEIFFWIFLYVSAIYIGLQSRFYLLRFPSICLTTFISGFLLISELTEISVGTALRHRSILALLLIVFIGLHNSKTRGVVSTKV